MEVGKKSLGGQVRTGEEWLKCIFGSLGGEEGKKKTMKTKAAEQSTEKTPD